MHRPRNFIPRNIYTSTVNDLWMWPTVCACEISLDVCSVHESDVSPEIISSKLTVGHWHIIQSDAVDRDSICEQASLSRCPGQTFRYAVKISIKSTPKTEQLLERKQHLMVSLVLLLHSVL